MAHGLAGPLAGALTWVAPSPGAEPESDVGGYQRPSDASHQPRPAAVEVGSGDPPEGQASGEYHSPSTASHQYPVNGESDGPESDGLESDMDETNFVSH